MKKLSTILFAACSFTLTAYAHEISADQSLGKAVATISKRTYANQMRGKADFALVHTQKCEQNGKALYYVFGDEQNGGFVITGADHRANSVLGYTENGTFEQALTIPAFRSWLSGCEAAMQWLSDKEESGWTAPYNIPDQVVTNADRTISMTIPGRRYTEDTTLPASVEPLLGGIVWGQGEPFNRLCPELLYKGDTIKCPAGCVATATAQVMKYWEWPKQGTGSYQYTSGEETPIELEADFSQSVYDWDNMLDDYSGDYTDEQAYAVAKLMSDVGIAENMQYDAQSSTSGHSRTIYAMATYFGYNKGMQECMRAYYTYAEWNDLLKNELAQSRPVLYSGLNEYANSGHEFVLDGYNEEGYYHVNWGWGGSCNGYFDINYMDPEDQGIGGSTSGYRADQMITIGCFPDIDGTSVAHYQMIVYFEPSYSPDLNMISCSIVNTGLAPYVGQIGFIALIDNEVVGKVVQDVEEMPFMKQSVLMIPFDDLGVTPEMIGDKKCIIYPVFLEGEDFEVPLSHTYVQNYVMMSVDADGNLVSETVPEENPSLICESIEITRDYAGFRVKGRAVLTNQEGYPAFDRPLSMVLFDADTKKALALGGNFAFIDAGESRELEFSCIPVFDLELEAGKTYSVSLSYTVGIQIRLVPGSETTVTLKDPGAEPSLSYAGFALDKTVIAPNEDITVSFDAENAGGFGVETFYIALYEDGVIPSLNAYKVEADLPAGTTTITKAIKGKFDEGAYHFDVFTLSDDGDKNKLTPEPLNFTIKNPATAISNLTGDANDSYLYYDLQGRRVANPTKGLYIQDGKKVMK